jgi:L-threonylcarbamoyladenylate synthase
MTEILPISRKSIKRARRLLRDGEIVAFPTDTVYGVGVNAFDRSAVRKLYKAKKRPAEKAVPVFITQIDDLDQVARDVPDKAWKLLKKFWPGALTVVLLCSPNLPDEVTAGQDTIAVRLPAHPVCLELVKKVGSPLAVTSANISGQAAPTSAEDVLAQLEGRIALILDGGQTPTPHPSSIVDLSVYPPRLLREGDLSLDILKEYLPKLEIDADNRP